MCMCAHGYTGDNCDVEINNCEDNTCLNGGTCVDGSCVCLSKYTGQHCEHG